MHEGHDISQRSDTVLRQELATFLQQAGLPLPLARVSAYLARTVNWEKTYTLATDPIPARDLLESWLAHDDACRLVNSNAQDGVFLIDGIIFVDGSAVGSFSPKVVATTILISHQTPSGSSMTLLNRVKVGYFSGRNITTSAQSACAYAADMTLEKVAGPPEK